MLDAMQASLEIMQRNYGDIRKKNSELEAQLTFLINRLSSKEDQVIKDCSTVAPTITLKTPAAVQSPANEPVSETDPTEPTPYVQVEKDAPSQVPPPKNLSWGYTDDAVQFTLVNRRKAKKNIQDT
ncbi:hypothetical protein JTB14_028115 [Gonioctena quinquepunctata]|nr:hypothetical protein JTB14_028115 [Gonioctena quinquepunctata]